MTSRKFIVEIRGCNFKNKGDVLMAESVISRMQDRYPGIQLVSRTLNTRGALKNPCALGKCISPRYSSGRSRLKTAFQDLLNSAPAASALDRLFGVVPSASIEGIIDVCGFSYGDAWGPTALEADYRYYSEAAACGKPIILMPKSFGPFSDASMAAKVKAICEMATLCFVRDRTSYGHLLDAGINEKTISRFPDFTSSATAIASPRYAYLAGRPAIIPNYRMIDAGQLFSEQQYVDFLGGVYRLMDEQYGQPYLLVHDTGRDPLLAASLSENLGYKIETINEPVSLINKGIIAASSFVYSDRLHGAISAALQKVPVCSMGWSHKYRHMLADFGLEWALLEPMPLTSILPTLRQISYRYIQGQDIDARQQAINAVLEKNEAMWSIIAATTDKLAST
jgi:colanic acid/amylovoran biosynthesis protein